MDQSACTLLGVPLELGAENIGPSSGPYALRERGIIKKLEQAALKIHDAGDIDVKKRSETPVGNSRLRHLDEIVRVNQASAQATAAAVKRSHKVIALGGDHSIALGTFSGASAALNGQLGMIYIDAHPDINTPDTTPTGNIHGMHLAALLGFGPPELSHLHSQQTKLAKENLLLAGISDPDPAETALIARENIRTFTLFDALTNNFAPLWKMIDQLAARVPNIWVSLDLDAIDKQYAPGVSIQNDKGFTYREITTVAEYIGSRCNVVGLDLVEYNPRHDERYKTAELGISLIAKLLGKNYSSYTSYLADSNL